MGMHCLTPEAELLRKQHFRHAVRVSCEVERGSNTAVKWRGAVSCDVERGSNTVRASCDGERGSNPVSEL